MTNRLLRFPVLTVALALAALLLVACGGGKQPTTDGTSEGAYIQAGPLVYQVQMSRELNPSNVEDNQYLQGLPAGTPPLAGDEEWFGVWLRVQNATGAAHPSARDFKIVDTTGAEYAPIALPATNVFSYQPVVVQSDSGQPVQPDPESAAGSGPINGSMVLFKLKTAVYANRPLRLEIAPPDGGAPSSVVLDL
ncbi:MAG TPA: hypothetical protein VFF79_10960 [Conexibacter sp.]|jgi:hypothetical protein|nr:hypothetical protein [Conexibacter sp.]